MTIKAVTDFIASWFTPDDQEGEETPARFLIKPLNGVQYAEIVTEFNQATSMLTASGISKTLKYGLKDWEGIEGSEGALTYDAKNLKYLPGDYHHLIAAEIISRSSVQEDEIKK